LSHCTADCGIDRSTFGVDDFFSATAKSEEVCVLRVDHAPIHDTNGAKLSGFTCGDAVIVFNLHHTPSCETLTSRYQDQVRGIWPQSHRFQVPHETFFCSVLSRDRRVTNCVLHVASDGERSMSNARLQVDDAAAVVEHATHFNSHMLQSSSVTNCSEEGEVVPSVKVCAPVACEVVNSKFPDELPKGCACTLTQYDHTDVNKFVFDSVEKFSEVPHAFFHYVAFSTRSEEFVCDLQGHEDDEGCICLIDPVMLKLDTPSVAQFLDSALREQPSKVGRGLHGKQGPLDVPADRFVALHPKCGQLCETFDPMRRGVIGKTGFCGISWR